MIVNLVALNILNHGRNNAKNHDVATQIAIADIFKKVTLIAWIYKGLCEGLYQKEWGLLYMVS